MPIPTYDQVHVVSDLHLGGPRGAQIFNQKTALAWLIHHVATLRPKDKVALILNGDVVDFLADFSKQYLNVVDPQDQLQRICTDDAFQDVWDALASYLKTARRYLIIVLGNHDVELALPVVQDALRRRLAGDNIGAAGRLVFATDGAGYLCQIGKRKILCLHGNEFDDWNVVDTFALHQVIQAQNRMTPVPAWSPNAGTKMVIDVMNDIKKHKKWVDLLKPEDKSLIALLIVAYPPCLTKLHALPGIAGQLIEDRIKRRFGFLSDEDLFEEDIKGRQLFDKMLMDDFGLHQENASSNADIESLLSDAEEAVAAETSPLDFSEEGMLGVGGAIWDLLNRRSPQENMRNALKNWGRNNQAFDPFHADNMFHKIDQAVGRDLDFVVAGHTHLQRSLERVNGSGAYFNSGTWIRLVKITDEMLSDDAHFKPVWKTLQDGSLDALDREGSGGCGQKLAHPIRTMVSMCRTDTDQVRGCLQTVEDAPKAFQLQEIKGSEHLR